MKKLLAIIGGILMIIGFLIVIGEQDFKNYREVVGLFIAKFVGLVLCYGGYKLLKSNCKY